MKIHLCALTTVTQDSSVNFASMILRLPQVLPDCTVRVEFFQNPHAAYEAFYDSNEDVFVCMPTYADGTDFLRALVVNRKEWTPVVVAKHLKPDILWTPDGPKVEYNVPDGVDSRRYTSVSPESIMTDQTLPLSFAVARYEGMPRNLRQVLETNKIVCDMHDGINIYAKHVFKGCVGHRRVLR